VAVQVAESKECCDGCNTSPAQVLWKASTPPCFIPWLPPSSGGACGVPFLTVVLLSLAPTTTRVGGAGLFVGCGHFLCF
jgi:hypothetical protein